MDTDKGHEFVEIAGKRWCMGCDLFQTRPWIAGAFPPPRSPCPCDTPYAERRDGARQLPLEGR